jgi:hypothetical protein
MKNLTKHTKLEAKTFIRRNHLRMGDGYAHVAEKSLIFFRRYERRKEPSNRKEAFRRK